jgi:hypothetical protein
MNKNYNQVSFGEDTIKRVKEIDAQLKDEREDNGQSKKYTKLMFEQLLRGIYLTSYDF